MLVLYFPCWIYWVETQNEKKETQNEKKEKQPETQNEKKEKRFGVWEELYGAIDGAKCWYNTETKETTTKDPFR